MKNEFSGKYRFLIIGGLALFGVFLLYEISFRYVTASSGELDLEVVPPRIYYSDDLVSSYEWRRAIFGFRSQLPLGKVSLAHGTGLHVHGGRFYRRLNDGSWQDLTDTMIEYHHKKRSGDLESVAH